MPCSMPPSCTPRRSVGRYVISPDREGSRQEKTVSEQPQTWHYGLIAQWWAEFNVARPEEFAYYRAIIAQNGQPALDLACGTGRLLLPLLQAGLDVDGCDLSPDMLALCRERAARVGLTPRLYAQAMHALDVPRAYRTIYICDAFGLGASARRTPQRCGAAISTWLLAAPWCSTTTCPMTARSSGRIGNRSSGGSCPRPGP